MSQKKGYFANLRFSRRQIALGLILCGIVLIIFYGISSLRSFLQFRYQVEQLPPGSTDVTLISPWMTIPYIGVAFGVPELYLFDALDIPPHEPNRRTNVGELNRIYERGFAEDGHTMNLELELREVILTYQQNPVPTGLRGRIEGWMTIRYVANSTGVPESYIFEELGIPAEGNSDVFLGDLHRLYKPEERGGAFFKRIDDITKQYQEAQGGEGE